ncbi:MAG TPA: cytochrome c [Acidimicrobiales bacterium]
MSRVARRGWPAVALVALALLVGACSDGGTPELSGSQADDPVLVLGRQVYMERCARCHGGSGGGGAGPKLSDGKAVERYPEPSQQEAVVREGRGTMPAWDGVLSDEEIEAVVRFTREVL